MLNVITVNMKNLILLLTFLLLLSCSDNKNTEQEGWRSIQNTNWLYRDTSVLQGAVGKVYLEQDLTLFATTFELVKKKRVMIEDEIILNDSIVYEGTYICKFLKIELRAEDLFMFGNVREKEMRLSVSGYSTSQLCFKKESSLD